MQLKCALISIKVYEQSAACVLVLVKFLALPPRPAVAWCCLDPSPWRPVFAAFPPSPSLLTIMGVDSCLMRECHRCGSLMAAPLHLTGLRSTWKRNETSSMYVCDDKRRHISNWRMQSVSVWMRPFIKEHEKLKYLLVSLSHKSLQSLHTV